MPKVRHDLRISYTVYESTTTVGMVFPATPSTSLMELRTLINQLQDIESELVELHMKKGRPV